MTNATRKIAVIGLGYVGLPAALALARKFPGTIGFDISTARVEALRAGVDATGEVPASELVSGQDAATLELVAEIYGAVVEAGVHRASSIQVAEASKVIENIQRDLNIGLMNELALIFDRLGVDTSEVLAAAGTKWNSPPSQPRS